MQRSLVLAVVLLFAALAGLGFWLLRSDDAPPPIAGGDSAAALTAVTGETGTPPAASDPTPTAPVREAVAAVVDDITDDADVRAGLCGFKGRVVDHRKEPVAHTGVRMYRGALDMIVPVDGDLFAPESTYVPNYIAGETKTAADGTWQLTGIWPNGFHLVFAGIGSDAPVHQIVTRTPSRGEIIDLGDIVLPHAGVISGTVLDDNGDPLAGALVRAADLPGTLAALFPIERFDPDGAVLIREQGPPVRVVEMPAWVKRAFEHLPIPSTRTDAEGRFRLVGVVPGSNLLATTATGFLSDVKPSVQVRASQEKDVGKIRMKRGEELLGKVLDTAGKPVAGADVFAGSTLTVAPVDLAQRLKATDAEGRFTGQGFAAGKVTVAARRGKGHPWTLAEPQSILGEVVVTLPATFAIEATIALADGAPAKEPRLQLLHGRAGNGAAEMFLLGLSPPIDLSERKKQIADGRWRIDNLLPGTYTLLADAPGHATAFAVADVTATDATVTLSLTAPKTFVVRVLDPQQQPIRNATIYAEARGTRTIEMPVRVGRTGADGKLVVDKLTAEELRVSADHPKWGVVHGEVKLGQELTMVMQAPGTLHGVVAENGKPPEFAKFTVIVEPRGGNGPRGPLEAVPPFLSPGLDGTFTMKALQPGTYSVQAIRALDSLRSPGGIFDLVQEMRMSHDLPRERVTITSGQSAHVKLEVGQKPIDGPTAQITGSFTLDGKAGAGHVVTYDASERRFSARVDERGRFDLGLVPAGDGWLNVLPTTEGMMFGRGGQTLWSSSMKLAAAETKELTIEVLTTSVRGRAVQADGSPVANGYVQANGRLKGAQGGSSMWLHAQLDAEGAFHFPSVAAGTWSFDVRGQRGGMRGKVEGVEVVGGVPIETLRVEVRSVPVVKGRVDLSTVSEKKPEWAWISFHRLAATDESTAEGNYSTGVGIDMSTGNFQTSELEAGRFRVRLHVQSGDRQSVEYYMDEMQVPANGLSDLQLRVGGRVTR